MYCQNTARKALTRRLKSLRTDPKSEVRKLSMIVERLGIEPVLDAMCKYSGPMHNHYERNGNYIVSLDDLRRCLNDFRSKLMLEDTRSKTLYYQRH